jgi:hypothetical protein
LENVDNPNQREVADVLPGQRIMIPRRIAHKVFAEKGTILVGITEQPYSGPQQDIPYKVTTTIQED